jgi:hypothetical protein
VKALAKEWTATLEMIGWNSLVITNGEAHQVQVSDQSLTKLDIKLDTLCTICCENDLVR